MAIINFQVTKQLEKKITQAVKTQGFTSKAEFFRFLALNFLNRVQPMADDEIIDDIGQEKFDSEIKKLTDVLHQATKGKKLPSLEEQLSDLR